MRSLTTLFLALGSVALAEGPEFDVASIKVSQPLAGGAIFFGPSRGGPGTADPTHITWSSATLKSVLMTAFDMKAYQVTGPDTIDSQRYDFAIGVPEVATKEQVGLMWRNLLASRFGLKYHIEQKEFPVDNLVVGPQGHKLTESTVTAPAEPVPPPGPPPLGKDGKPAMTGPGMMMMLNTSPNGVVGRAMAKGQPVSALADMISNQIGHPVVDKTGLTGKYDFEVEFAPQNIRLPGGLVGPGRGAAPATGATPELGLELHEAIQQQLGLRLEGSKGKLDVIVVDKVERVPTEN